MESGNREVATGESRFDSKVRRMSIKSSAESLGQSRQAKGARTGTVAEAGGGEVKAAAHRNEANPNQNLMRGTNGKRGRQGEGMGKGSGSCCDSCKKLRNFCATFVCYHRW